MKDEVGRQAAWLGRSASLAILCLLCTPLATAADDTAEQRFLAGLRERGLLKLAEKYCIDRLKQVDLSETRRADVTIELSCVLSDQAVNAPPDARGPLWQRAQQATDDFAAKNSQSPHVLLVRLQGALNLLTRGELVRQEAQAAADGGPLLDDARAQLSAAIEQLRTLDEAVEQQLAPERSDPTKLSPYQLAALQKNIRHELPRALRNYGQCYPEKSPDRVNALTQAVKLLASLAKLDRDDPLYFRSRIDLIVCQRLLGDVEAAASTIQALLAEKPPPAVELRVRAERIRGALAGGGLPAALTLLADGREMDGLTSPELDCAWLETYLSAWQAAAKTDDKAQLAEWQKKADAMVRLIESSYGPYWKRRAESLLVGSVRASPNSGDLNMWVRAAEGLFRSGRPDEAIAAYRRAAKAAVGEGNADRAFELLFVAATIEHQRNRHEPAMAAYRQLAVGSPKHAKAAEAHLLAAYHAAQLAKDGQPASTKQYVDLLQEHLQTWPAGRTADDVRRRLGRIYEYQRDWAQAVAAYRGVSAKDAEFLPAVESVERCYRAWLTQKKAAREPTEPVAVAAADWLEAVALGRQGRWPAKWGAVERFAALAAARLLLDETAAGHSRAAKILSAALEAAADAPAEWKSAAETMLVCSLAGAGQRREAGDVLKKLTGGSTEQILAMLDGLGRLAVTARPEVRREIGALQLLAIEPLWPARDKLTPSQRLSVERLRAQALADAGRTDEALAAFRSLVKAYPQDLSLQHGEMRLLLARGDKASLQAVLDKCRQLDKDTVQGSPRWLRIQYWIVSAQYGLGNRQPAAARIRVLQELYPKMGGPGLKAEFDELLSRCGK
jgi:tetratricopeptide (TPR) repeat protein